MLAAEHESIDQSSTHNEITPEQKLFLISLQLFKALCPLVIVEPHILSQDLDGLISENHLNIQTFKIRALYIFFISELFPKIKDRLLNFEYEPGPLDEPVEKTIDKWFVGFCPNYLANDFNLISNMIFTSLNKLSASELKDTYDYSLVNYWNFCQAFYAKSYENYDLLYAKMQEIYTDFQNVHAFMRAYNHNLLAPLMISLVIKCSSQIHVIDAIREPLTQVSNQVRETLQGSANIDNSEEQVTTLKRLLADRCPWKSTIFEYFQSEEVTQRFSAEAKVTLASQEYSVSNSPNGFFYRKLGQNFFNQRQQQPAPSWQPQNGHDNQSKRGMCTLL